MNVLSLFDGMSCGQIALRELGVEPEVYYASEIDKYAIRQTQYNFPATVQLGDVERWREWEIDWAGIDLVLAGSPCQGFSFAGKQLAFDDPRSRLFFVFVDILNHVRRHNPEVRFLLENVNMKREYLRVISEHVGVSPVRINSALVSAQNRNRWYWTDIKTRREGLFGELHSDIPQPEDRGIVLADILETEVPEKYNVSEKMARYITDPKRLGKYTDLNDGSRKSACLVAKTNNSWTETFLVQRQRGYNRGGTHTDKAPTLSAAGMGGALSAVIQLNPAREFGSQPGDVCLMAEAGGQAVGAVWARIMDDYGHVDDETPSLAISLYPAYRGRGIGTNLLEHMLTRLRQGGYKQVSLSVQKASPAANLYRRMGFEIFRGTEEEWIMVRRL